MNCSSCAKKWDSETCVPKILECGHSLCAQCAHSLYRAPSVVCPNCGHSQVLPESLSGLATNYTLLDLVESLKKNSSFRHFSIGAMCEQHFATIHSFTPRPYSLLCTSCIEEIEDLNLNVTPIPDVVEYLRGLLEDSHAQLTKKNSEIQEALESAISFSTLEENKSMTALETHFSELREQVSTGYMKQKKKLTEFLATQSSELDAREREINAKTKTLEELDARCKYLEALPDREIVRYAHEVDGLLSVATAPVPTDLAICPEIALVCAATEFTSIQQLLHSSYSVSFTASNRHWECSCSAENSLTEVQCKKCTSFRPLKIFEKQVNEPLNVSPEEIALLQQRRTLEYEMISKLDVEKEGSNKWYLINAEWINEWKAYIFNKPRKSRNVSKNTKIGVLPPGPISNCLLFEDPANPTVIRQRLKPVMHYRGINESVWDKYLSIYGGGPAVVRNKLNIYENIN